MPRRRGLLEDLAGFVAALVALLILLGFVLGFASTARADQCKNGDPKAVVEGKPAPCDGIVMSEADSLHLADQKALLKKERIEHEKTRVKLDEANRESVLRQEKCDGKLNACDVQVKTLSEQLAKRTKCPACTPPWYEGATWAGPFAVGMTSSAATLVGFVVTRDEAYGWTFFNDTATTEIYTLIIGVLD
jgi:hypothetical protein